MHNFKRPLSAASVTELSYSMKSLVVILGLLVAAVQAAPGGRSSDGPTPLNVYMPLIEGALKVQVPKIIGGSPAKADQFPHHGALVIDGGTSFCGCSLISPHFVLTAGHCADQANSFEVILGRIQWSGVGGVSIKTSIKVVHKEYSPVTLTNDIAILYLPTTVTYTATIRPVLLPPRVANSYEGRYAQVSGFGSTYDNGPISPTLNYVQVLVVNNGMCAAFYGTEIIKDSTICSSGADGRTPCVGDSGSALVINNGVTYMQIGIVSFVSTAGCAANGFPSGYARVSSFLDWIHEYTGL